MSVATAGDREAVRELFEGILKGTGEVRYGPLRLFKPDSIAIDDRCWRVECVETGESKGTVNLDAFPDEYHLRAHLNGLINGDGPPWWVRGDSPYSECSGQTTR